MEITARLDDGLTSMEVAVCFRGRAPEALEAGAPSRVHARGHARMEGGRLALDPRDGGCARYDIDLAAEAEGWRVARGGAALMISNRTWLLRPARIDPALAGVIRLALPAGVRVVTPWRGDGARFDLDSTHLRWEGYLVVTGSPRRSVETRLATFEVAALDGGAIAVEPWLTAASEAVAPLAGGRLVGPVQVILDTRGAPAAQGCVFGLSSRGGGASLLFVVGRDATAEALRSEWVAVHELVHQLLPVTRDEDAWLGEGIATYYQEVLRARAGMISPTVAWANLLRGLAAGAAATADARTLAEVSAGRGSYTRLYWSGAALALRWDIALRARGASLDAVVRGWRRCCAEDGRTWPALELLARASAETGLDLAAEARAALADTSFPALREAFAALGIARVGDGAVTFGAPRSSLRDAIMASSPGAARAP
jgi:hypothetical protein